MKVELPSGNVVELRTGVNNRDRKRYIKAQEEGPREEVAVTIPIKDEVTGEPLLDGNGEPMTEVRVVNSPTALGSMEITNVMLALLIDSWTFDFEVPRAAASPERQDEILDELLDIEDFDAIAEAARPTVRKLFVSDKPDPKDKEAPTGPSSD